MAAFIDLHPGMHVHVMPRDGALSSAFESVIRDVAERGIHIDTPWYEGEALPMAPGDELALFVQTGGRIYRLFSTVRLVDSVGGGAMIEHPVEADHAERRQFYRLLTTIAPRYAARTNAEGEELERLDARVLDLSGGGLQLHVRDWVPVGSRVRLIFTLDDDPQDVDSTVVALSVVRPGPRRSLYRVHCRFVDLPRSERERIVRFIFRKQVDFRQRGVA